MKTTKRTFEIEWPEDSGPMWMNQDNLLSCLITKVRCKESLIVSVRDVTANG